MNFERDINYRTELANPSATSVLDVYFSGPDPLKPRSPIVVFLHGGGWKGGDKRCFDLQADNSAPAWFVDRGYVFVAVNFTLPGSTATPAATIGDACADIARALKWLNVHGRRYGGNVKDILLFGFSSGAHLASLVVSDPSYFQAVRFDGSSIRGVICADVGQYDVPRAIARLERGEAGGTAVNSRVASLRSVFGSTPDEQVSWSPAAFVGHHLADTRFLLLSTGRSIRTRLPFTRVMSEDYRAQLEQVGVGVEHRHFPDAEHRDCIDRFEVTISQAIERFLDQLQT